MRWWTRGTWAAAVAAVLAGGVPGGAATFAVNDTADDVDAAPGNGLCATAGGTCTLRAAVMETNALAGADVVTLPAGVYGLLLTGSGEDAGLTGDLDVADALEVNGAGADATVVDGLGADRVFHVVGATPFALRDLTVRNGNAAASSGGGLLHAGPSPLVLERVAFTANQASTAGGIFASGSGVTVADSTFAGNFAGTGGALVAVGAGSLDVHGTTFTDNASISGPGGGIIMSGTGPVAIAGCRFSSNFGAGGADVVVAGTSDATTIADSEFADAVSLGNGGSLLYSAGGDVTITNSRFHDGFAASGGGAALVVTTGSLTITGTEIADNMTDTTGGTLYYVSPAGGLTIRDSVFRGNNVLSALGGAVYASTGGPLELTRVVVRDNAAAQLAGGVIAIGQASTAIADSRFAGNRTAGPAGGLYDAGAGPTTITGSTFSDNTAGGGPGGGLFSVTTGTVTVEGTTFARNSATSAGAGFGGGMFNAPGSATTVRNCTFSANQATMDGAGLYTAVATTVVNATFAGNVGSPMRSQLYAAVPGTVLTSTILTGTTASCAGSPVASGGNNIDADGSCALAATGDRTGIDPLLGPLADNGGPTATHALLPGSPAIDAGNAAACPATDQRGVARPTDGDGDGTAACDVGAFEFVDGCPEDPGKVEPGVCGCGVPDTDANANGVADCLVNAELKARVARARVLVEALTGERTPEQTATKTDLKATAADILAFVRTNQTAITLADPSVKLMKLAKRAKKKVGGTLRRRGSALSHARTRAMAALDALDGVVP
jgi:CSLREA domain-containing protein